MGLILGILLFGSTKFIEVSDYEDCTTKVLINVETIISVRPTHDDKTMINTDKARYYICRPLESIKAK